MRDPFQVRKRGDGSKRQPKSRPPHYRLRMESTIITQHANIMRDAFRQLKRSQRGIKTTLIPWTYLERAVYGQSTSGR